MEPNWLLDKLTKMTNTKATPLHVNIVGRGRAQMYNSTLITTKYRHPTLSFKKHIQPHLSKEGVGMPLTKEYLPMNKLTIAVTTILVFKTV